ncbi:hypothetical protein TrCOL_g1349 [Triparma columacea]|uniref:Protein kinase domain-containing protein n=1 Tax=Triparma columacea TaxID=722753 RepID=A0A9W7L6M3_9STRA|nr:hypothetical protein TrCOL_g1349 [Triparma columacea]
METVFVLYQDVDEEFELSDNFEEALIGPESNAFTIQVDPTTPVRMIHLHRQFPLSSYDDNAHFIFRVPSLEDSGCYVDLTNPGQLVPRLGPEGSVVCKVFRSPVPLPTPSEEDVMVELKKPVPRSYFNYRKGMSSSLRRPSNHMGGGGFEGGGLRRPSGIPFNQEKIDETLENVNQTIMEGAKQAKEMGRKLSTAMQSIDEEKIKRSTKKLVSGVKGLWKNFKESTETFLDKAGSFSTAPIPVGRHTVRIQTQLAEGGFSTVYLVSDETPHSPNPNGHLALKRMICQTRDSKKDASMEVKILRLMDHPNIIGLLDSDVADAGDEYGRGSKVYHLLFEYIEKTCYDVMAKNITMSRQFDAMNVNSYNSPFAEVEALEILLGCANGLAYMHDKFKVCHRDFKPHNVLLRNDGRGFMGGPTAVVMDVGSIAPSLVEVKTKSDALNVEEEAASKCSAPYRCPELTSVEVGAVIDVGSDMWSLGCTFFALAFGYCPFETPKEGIMKLAILNARWAFPRSSTVNQYSEGYKNAIGKLLSRDPLERGTAMDCVEDITVLLSLFKS